MTFHPSPEFLTAEKHSTIDFGRVIAPMTSDRFISEFWGKEFVHLRGERGKFRSLVSWDGVNFLLDYHRFEGQGLRLFKDGESIDISRYLTANKELKPAELTNYLAEGATLIVNDVDTMLPSVRQLAEAFEDATHARSTVNLYAGWRTQAGLDLHWDVQDTMIIQVSGRKHWSIYAPTYLHPLEINDESTPQPNTEPVWDGILEDGDALYLPRGWWHIALPLNEPSLHLTVSIVPAKGLDLLRWSVEQLRSNPAVRMNVPHLGNKAERQRYVEGLRELLMKSWSDEALERFLAEWESGIPLRPRISLPSGPEEVRKPISMATNVRLASTRKMIFLDRPDNGTIAFVAGGFEGECSSGLVPALKLLSGTVDHSIAELCTLLSNQTEVPKLMILIAALAMRGAVQIEPPRQPEHTSPG